MKKRPIPQRKLSKRKSERLNAQHPLVESVLRLKRSGVRTPSIPQLSKLSDALNKFEADYQMTIEEAESFLKEKGFS